MEDLARLFQLLSEPVRLQIIARLARESCCVCEIYEALNLPQSTVSRHLAILRSAGLVSVRRQGVWMHYWLSPEGVPPAWRELLGAVTAELVRRSGGFGTGRLCTAEGAAAMDGAEA